MQIDKCGRNSVILRNMYKKIIEQNNKNLNENGKKNITNDEIDESLYTAYQRILNSSLGDEDITKKSLAYLERYLEMGKFQISDIPNIAENLAIEVIKDENLINKRESDSVSSLATGVIVGATLSNLNNDNNNDNNNQNINKIVPVFNSWRDFVYDMKEKLCNEELLNNHNLTYTIAVSGEGKEQEEAICILDLVNKSTNYMVQNSSFGESQSADNLTDKDLKRLRGIEAGALSLMYQLIKYKQNQEAKMMLEKLAEHFKLTELITEPREGIDIAQMINNRFIVLVPKGNLEKIFDTVNKKAKQNKTGIIKSSQSLETIVRDDLEKRRQREFINRFKTALTEGKGTEDISLAQNFIMSNINLARKIKDVYEKNYEIIKNDDKIKESEGFRSVREGLEIILDNLEKGQISKRNIPEGYSSELEPE